VISGPRVGIDYAEEFTGLPWRFWVDGNPYVSKIRTPLLNRRGGRPG
jgi:DNA-3-methyladenine glycosylase